MSDKEYCNYKLFVINILSCLLVLLSFPVGSWAESQEALLGMSLEELMQIEVYSASKKIERANDVAAAVFVISSEDIRRSTANSVPELLRVVPGLQVARISASAWSVSSRGFNGRFSNKLLVLMDGRTVYNPIFSGVYWNIQDTVLEDIERIEVIRGPGGTLWGANAVNGVINIITKHAKDTNGILLSAGGGSEERGFASLRYGEKVPNGDWRFYTKYYNRDDSADPLGGDAYDATEAVQAGFRADLDLSSKDKINLQADIFSDNERNRFGIPSVVEPHSIPTNSRVDHNGGNIMARWDRQISDTSSTMLQVYYNRMDRKDAIADLAVDTFDLEFNHLFELAESHDFAWGLGFRNIDDEMRDQEAIFTSDPEKRSVQVFSGFLQDDISLTDSLRLVIGAKLSHNDYSHFEVQPNIRSVWSINSSNTVWASVSRAVRTPNRSEDDLRGNFSVASIPGVGPVITRLVPGRGSFDSEELIAYELGYRAAPLSSFNIDLALFYFDYDELSELTAGEMGLDFSTGIPVPVTELSFINALEGESYGGELVTNIQAFEWWRLQATYSYLRMNLKNKFTGLSGPEAGFLTDEEEQNPQHQATLRSLIDLPGGFEFDAFFRYVDRLKLQGIAAYTELDLRLAWRFSPNVTIAVVGNNLLDDENNEFSDVFPTVLNTLQERGVFGKVTLEF